MAGISPLLIFAGHNALLVISLAVIMMCSLLWILGWFVFIFTTLITATLRRNFEAGLLLLSLLLEPGGLD